MTTYYKKYFPSKALEHHVSFFYYFHSTNNCVERILPIGTTEITIRLNSGFENIDIFLANPATQFNFEKPKSLGEIVGICFHPWAFNSLFGISQSEIINIKIPLNNVLNATYNKLVGKLKGITNYLDAISTIQSYLVSILNNKQDTVIVDAVNFITEKRGQVQMRTLYKRYNISERRLQQLFNSSIGMSPKRYSLLKKFHSSVTQLNLNRNLTEIALNLDYYDQAHFINEFKSFAGICPSGMLKEKNILNKINAEAYFGV